MGNGTVVGSKGLITLNNAAFAFFHTTNIIATVIAYLKTGVNAIYSGAGRGGQLNNKLYMSLGMK